MDYIETNQDYLKKLMERCNLRGYSEHTIKTYSYNVSNKDLSNIKSPLDNI